MNFHVALGTKRHHKAVNIPFCDECEPSQENTKRRTCEDVDRNDCKVSFDNLDNAQITLLHWHSKLDHMGFNALKDLCHKVVLPQILALAKPINAQLMLKEMHKISKPDKSDRIVKDDVKDPGGLMHTDQSESSTPSRPSTFSGNNARKENLYNIFICR